MGTTTTNDPAAVSPGTPAAAVPPQGKLATTITPPAGWHSPPDEPLVVIEPTKAWAALDFHDLWAYRELLYFLAWRDIRVRYKQTVLGVVWIILQPLLMTVIFTIFLGHLARVPTGGIPYALFVYVGLLPWTFFSSAVLGSGQSLVTSSNLVTKVYFPRAIVPAASVGGRLIDFAVAFVMLAGLMLYYGVAPTSNLLMLPPLVLLIVLMAFSLGLLISSLNVRYRDIGVALPVLIQLWMFTSPVLYPVDLVPERWRVLYSLNPLVGIIDGFRVSLLGGNFNWLALGVSAGAAVALLVCSAYMFRRIEKSLSDLI